MRSEGRKTLLFVGRLEQRKGLATLLDAYAELRRLRDDVRLVIVGGGNMRWGYERYVTTEGIPDVYFAGHVAPALLPRCYTSADIFCSPALRGESFGIVLLEAMASGVPIIASAIPGFNQVVTPDQDGVLVPPANTEAWTAAIQALLDDPERRRRLADAGLQTAQRFDWARIVDAVLDVYAEARARARLNLVAAGVHESVSELG
jgi:phosphatidylinositol alpha-mannosyltransferase